MPEDDAFRCGKAILCERLRELASERGFSFAGVDVREEELAGVASYVFSLSGTTISISLRAREVRLAAERSTRLRYIEPRLASIFEQTWWARSVVLLGRRI